MKRIMSSIAAWVTVALVATGLPERAAAQSGDFYAGKTVKILVGLQAGGTVDTLARLVAVQLKKHIPGSPTIVVQNMPGAGGMNATNYLYEKAAPDGLTILFGPWDPLAQVLGDKALRARYEHFEFLGGMGDIRVIYGRTDAVPGGIKKPSDIMKAEHLILGALNTTDQSGLLPHLALNVLGIKHRMIIGFRGGSGVFLAMQRGEVQIHSTSIATFRSRNAAFIKSGDGIGITYLVPVGKDGRYERSKAIAEMPAFPDLYKEAHGKMPSGPMWEAFNWLTGQIGELAFVGLAPRGTPAEAAAALRKGFEGLARDADFEKDMIKKQGVPYSHIGSAQGRAIFGGLTDVAPGVIATLRTAVAERK